MLKARSALLVIFTCIAFTVVNAQTGSVLVYGDVMLDKQTAGDPYGKSSITNVAVAPGIGYQLSKHFTIGIQGDYSHMHHSIPFAIAQPNGYGYGYGYGYVISTAYASYWEQSWSAGIFGRYTQVLNDRFFLFCQLNASHIAIDYTNDNSQVQYMPSVPPGNGIYAEFYPAIDMSVYKGFGLNFSIGGIAYTNYHGFEGEKLNRIYLNFGHQYNLGISKNFGGHKPNDGIKKPRVKRKITPNTENE